MSKLMRAFVAVVLAMAVFAPMASAKTVVRFSAHMSANVNKKTGAISGSGSAATFGSCRVGGKLAAPNLTLILTFKKGTLDIQVDGKLNAKAEAYGPWKVIGGTGIFKGASGSGSATSSTAIGVNPQKESYSGSLTLKGSA